MPKQSEYSADKADAICQLIADGATLRGICARSDMPSSATVCRWLAANVEFRLQYTAAREAQAEIILDEVLAIADEAITAATPAEAAVAVHRNKLRIDARKWLIGRLAPKRYGERLDVAVAGTPKLGKLNWQKR